MIYHYCRVSTKDQHLQRQYNALSSYKQADRVFSDKASGKNFEREQYQLMKTMLVKGDEVVIKQLDRLGRNKDAVKAELMWFREHGVVIRILDIPTTLIEYNGQQWVFDMVNNIIIEVVAAIAQQERDHLISRVNEGIAAKRARGETDFGRPKVDTSDFSKFLQKQKEGLMTVDDCCKQMGISRATWYNRLRQQ